MLILDLKSISLQNEGFWIPDLISIEWPLTTGPVSSKSNLCIHIMTEFIGIQSDSWAPILFIFQDTEPSLEDWTLEVLLDLVAPE